MDGQEKFLTTRQFCERLFADLGVELKPETVRKWCRNRGFGKPLTPGGDYYISTRRIDEFRAAVS
jgi:hypothetical protein